LLFNIFNKARTLGLMFLHLAEGSLLGYYACLLTKLVNRLFAVVRIICQPLALFSKEGAAAAAGDLNSNLNSNLSKNIALMLIFLYTIKYR